MPLLEPYMVSELHYRMDTEGLAEVVKCKVAQMVQATVVLSLLEDKALIFLFEDLSGVV